MDGVGERAREENEASAPVALQDDWTGLVVFCSATSWDGIKGSDHHLAERLSRYAPVLYVDPPISHLTARRMPELASSLEPPRLRVLKPRFARLTPLAPPGKGRPGMWAVSNALRTLAIRRAVRRLGAGVHAVVAASLDPVYGAFPRALHVLYGTDDYVAGARLLGVPQRRLATAEERQLRDSNVVVAISPELADRWRAKGHDVHLVPNGCDVEAIGAWRGPVPAEVRLPGPIAGFVGHLNGRIDLALLEAVADQGTSLLLVGPRDRGYEGARLDALLGRPNAQWVGPKPFVEIPAYVGALAVGLVPYADTSFNRASFPLKMLEYLAAGKAVVATDLPSVRWLETSQVTVRSDPQGFSTAVAHLAASPGTAADVAERRAVAARHSWDERAASFAGLLGLPG